MEADKDECWWCDQKAENQVNKRCKMPIPFTMTQSGTIKANSLRNIGLILEQDEILKEHLHITNFRLLMKL